MEIPVTNQLAIIIAGLVIGIAIVFAQLIPRYQIVSTGGHGVWHVNGVTGDIQLCSFRPRNPFDKITNPDAPIVYDLQCSGPSPSVKPRRSIHDRANHPAPTKDHPPHAAPTAVLLAATAICFYQSFGKRLRFVRHQLDITEAEAAEAYGISLRTYRHYEAGHAPRDGSLGHLDFCEEFGIDLGWLLGCRGVMPPRFRLRFV
jgi:hypothetical protein